MGVDFVEKAKGGWGLAKGKECRKTWPGRVRVAGGPASLGALTSGVPLNKPERLKPDSGDLGWLAQEPEPFPTISRDLIGVRRRYSIPVRSLGSSPRGVRVSAQGCGCERV